MKAKIYIIILVLLTAISCDKDTSQEKSTDEIFLNYKSTLNDDEDLNAAFKIIAARAIQTKGELDSAWKNGQRLKLTAKVMGSREQAERIAVTKLTDFRKKNPDFMKLGKEMQKELLIMFLDSFIEKNVTPEMVRASLKNNGTQSMVVDDDDMKCYNGFSLMASQCRQQYYTDYQVGLITVVLDPIEFVAGAAMAELSYQNCLNDALDVFDACQYGVVIVD